MFHWAQNLTKLFTLLLPTMVEIYSTEAAFKDGGVVPDIIGQWPKRIATIEFDAADGRQRRQPPMQAELGNQLSVESTQRRPTLVDWGGEPDKLYTLAMIDPDAASAVRRVRGQDSDNKKKNSAGSENEWLHWLVVNIPGNELQHGDVVCDYMGPDPPKNSGPHRYVLVVYEHLSQLAVTGHCTLDRHRAGWSLRQFAREQDLGERPFAGNFFVAKKTSQQDSEPMVGSSLRNLLLGAGR